MSGSYHSSAGSRVVQLSIVVRLDIVLTSDQGEVLWMLERRRGVWLCPPVSNCLEVGGGRRNLLNNFSYLTQHSLNIQTEKKINIQMTLFQEKITRAGRRWSSYLNYTKLMLSIICSNRWSQSTLIPSAAVTISHQLKMLPQPDQPMPSSPYLRPHYTNLSRPISSYILQQDVSGLWIMKLEKYVELNKVVFLDCQPITHISSATHTYPGPDEEEK